MITEHGVTCTVFFNRYNGLCKQRMVFALSLCTNSILSFSMYILSKVFNIIHKRGDNMDENKKNEELIKFKKQWFNEDNQPVAGIELTLPPDIGSMLDPKSVDDESGTSNNE